jgi:EAL domain-containing protein (putative c-di-GMP-specific phosphodiesterase class I)
VLTQLRALGVRVALDDFGAGFTSLQHLRAFPIDVAKFDRGFVSASVEQSTGVLAGLIDLANDLDIDTVGERVEEGRRLASLRDMRCRYAQGFMISRPLPPEQLETLMAVEFGMTIAPRSITASGSALPASSAAAASLSR